MKNIVVEIKCSAEKKKFDLVIKSDGDQEVKVEKRHLQMPDFEFLIRFQPLRTNWAHNENRGDMSKDTLMAAHKDKMDFGKQLNNAFFNSIKGEWDKIIADNKGDFIFDVDPFFWKLPFELLYQIDSQGNGDYIDTSSTAVIRRIKGNNDVAKPNFLDNPTIYFVDANPIGHPTEAEEQFNILQSQIPHQLKGKVLIRNKPSAGSNNSQWERISSDLLRFTPSILHIVAHGKEADGIEIEGVTRDSDPDVLDYKSLVEHLIQIKSVKLLVIAACSSNSLFTEKPELINKLISDTEINAIVVMATDIGVKAIIKFTKYFYMALWYGMDVAKAIAYARSMFRNQEKKSISLQWSIPMCYQNSPVNPFYNYLVETANSPTAQHFPFFVLENALRHAQTMNETVINLLELSEQLTPSNCKLAFFKSDLKNATKYYEEELSHLNQIYEPRDEMLVDLIRKTSSTALPIINHCIVSPNNTLRVNDATVEASQSLVDCIEEAIHLVMVHESTEFRNWISK
jgi:hypothetical protein